MITATTQVTSVIGDPISHSLSPVIHNAAFSDRSLDWVCVALRVGEGATANAAEAMRVLGLRGMSVTMPHKSAIVASMDDLSDTASALGSVNCVVNGSDGLVGHNTDGAGFLGGLRDDFGFDPAGKSCAVLGAGGAARAVVLALAEAGAGSVVVVNRTAERAEAAAGLAGSVGSAGPVQRIEDADLVINATPIGMAGGSTDRRGELPCDLSLLQSSQIVAELIYHPARTALMAGAAARGCRTSNGVSMLVHQAAAAFQLWTQEAAPIDTMRSAAMAALAVSESSPGPNGPLKS